MTIITVISQQPITTEQVNSFRSVPQGITLTASGDGTSYLSNDGTYKLISGGGSGTDLSIANKTSTTLDVLSSTGTDVTLPAASITEAGLLVASDKVKLNNLGTASYLNAPISGNASSGEVVKGDDTRLSDARTPLSHTHVIADTTGLQTALDAKALKGANSDITSLSGITGNISTVDSIQFDTTAGVTPAIGKINWNDADGTFEIGLKGGNVVLQIGQEANQRVTNNTGSTLADGKVVYISGAIGNRLTVALGIASSGATADRTFGVLTESIADNQSGFVTTLGLVRDINTSALTEGAPVYLSSAVAGELTSTRPVAPNHAVLIGWCVRQHASVGSIFVHVQNGVSLDELHDTLIASKTDKDVVSYDSVSGLWKNKQLATSDIVGLDTALSGKQPLATVLTNTTASFTTALETKLNGVATGATANSSDATLLSRANHTGTQLASTISDFNTAADARVVAGITNKQPLDNDLTAIAALAGTSGFLKKTAVDTWTLDTSTYLTNNQTVTLSGDVTGSGTTAITTTIPSGTVTLAKMANLATNSLIGRYTAGSGVPEVITVGSGLSLSAGTLSATAGGGGTVTSASVVSANGFAGTVATATTTPAITISTTITGLLKGNGTAISAATAGTDYLTPTGSAASLTGLTSTQVTTALGFTPYNATNPSGYTSNTGTVTTFSFTNGGGFTGTVSTAGTTPALSLTLQNATTGQSGQLTSTDWNTFNGKQATLNGTGFVKVTGTTVSYDNSTYLTGNQTITVTGDVSGSGTTAITLNLGSNVVTNAKLAQVATATFKGRITASTGNVEDLTAAQATSLLNIFTTSSKGLVGASGGGTTNFLRADGTWAAPAGGGGGLTLTEFEVDFGTKPIRSKKFTITAAGVSGSSKVIVSPSGNVATGRVGDDWEWDAISTSAKAGTGQFVLTCFASGKVAGKRKFYYTYS